MSALLEPTPASPPEPPAGEPAVVHPGPAAEVPAPVERPCSTCSAALAEGQDWCLECGSAQPGRLGARPGWRAALTVVGAVTLLATGAGAAAYAALESEATRDATAQAPPVATPTQGTPPVATASTPAPATTAPGPAAEVDPPASEPAGVPAPKAGGEVDAPDTPSSSTPVAPSTPPSSTGADPSPGSGTAAGDTGATDPEPVEIELKSDFASSYDPYQRGGTTIGDPADAVDGKDTTAWEAPAGPDGQVRIGLLVSLDKAQKLGDLELVADTPGFTVETYATKSGEVPPDVLDARWKHLDDARDVGITETLKLDGTFRHVLLWITAQPADTKVAIPEIKLFEPKD